MAKKRLDSLAAQTTSKFFGQPSNVDSFEAEKNDLEENDIQIKDSKELNSDKNNKKQMFCFRGFVNDVRKWKLYATIKNIRLDELGSLAINEYIDNHHLNEVENALFDFKLKEND